jgi:aspartyl-tRNA(Asn)/glutamyl-tRNA(Gln) amidotransferase subunit A
VSDPADLSAAALVDLYRTRRLSPVEAVEAVIRRHAAVEPKVNAFVVFDAEHALQSARASEARWQRGEALGRLDGVPVSIKDLNVAKGWPTRRGSHTSSARIETEDAPLPARLREGGAVLLGKTTTSEYGWKGTGDSPLTGSTRNPWSLAHTTGGSSAGAAAAVVTGMGPLASGGDAGGSIRIPASFSGCFGLKPSYGRVPAWPFGGQGTLSHVGPMTRTVLDAALFMDVVARPDLRDWYALPDDVPDWVAASEGGVKEWRVAYCPRFGSTPVDAEVASLVAEAARAFEALGARVEEVPPPFEDPIDVIMPLWLMGIFGPLGGLPEAEKTKLDPGLRAWVEEGGRLATKQLFDANVARTELGARMRRFHQDYDILLTPAVAVTALPAGSVVPPGWPLGDNWFTWTPFSYPFNLTQQPAASIPCGFTAADLPVGLQIVGPHQRDDMVLRSARAYETVYSIADKRPPLT